MYSSSFFSLLLFVACGNGATDLLDLIPGNEYWREKGVEVTPATLSAELAARTVPAQANKLIAELGHDDPAVREAAAKALLDLGVTVLPAVREHGLTSDDEEVAARSRRLVAQLAPRVGADRIRLLMAIRTAGEMRLRAALPRLTELAKSSDPFEAEYAAAAVAAIEGRPYVRPHAKTGDEVWRLPASTRSVFHVSMVGGGVVPPGTVADAVAAMTANYRGGPAPGPEQVLGYARSQLRELTLFAEQFGNIRVDGITIGTAPGADRRAGWTAAIVRGRFDAAALRSRGTSPPAVEYALLSNAQVAVAQGTMTTGWRFAANDLAVVVSGGDDMVPAFEELKAAYEGGKEPLRQNAALAALVKRVDGGPIGWAAAIPSEADRVPVALAGAEWITLTSAPAGGGGWEWSLAAKGRRADGGPALLASCDASVRRVRAALDRELGKPLYGVPTFRQLAVSIQRSAADAKVWADPADPTVVRATATSALPPGALLWTELGATLAKPELPTQ